MLPSAFHHRFTLATVRLLRAVVGELCADFERTDAKPGGVLAGFRDVVATDATLIELHRLLAEHYPGTRYPAARRQAPGCTW